MTTISIEEKLARLPASPGVYIMKNSPGEAPFIGKAKDLPPRGPPFFAEAGGGNAAELLFDADSSHRNNYRIRFRWNTNAGIKTKRKIIPPLPGPLPQGEREYFGLVLFLNISRNRVEPKNGGSRVTDTTNVYA